MFHTPFQKVAKSLSLFVSSMVGDFVGIVNTGTADGSRYITKADRKNKPVRYISSQRKGVRTIIP